MCKGMTKYDIWINSMKFVFLHISVLQCILYTTNQTSKIIVFNIDFMIIIIGNTKYIPSDER